ncbi:THO complex subunit 7 [Apophysomyces ossiformis]|uniref:THO complex subunit 7 n=1 Tax=Apophysomyces ossiformis TaxID=679940 RepID=A0A8H7ERX4_9FUNG|nr:THO complex subunit 7 [Apophysomyces ossiformis]
MDDEAVLKTRLAIDDRPVKNLEKKVVAWLASLKTESIESAQHSYESLLIQISNYRTSLERHAHIQRANEGDIEHYANIVDGTGSTIVGARERITGLKEELKIAQKGRDNKLEYDKVAREIMKLQTRDAYHASIEQLQRDIDMLKREKGNKEMAFESRKRKFSELVESVKTLKASIDEERAQTHETQRMLQDMDQDYASSEEEESVSDDENSSPDHKATTNGFHRFQERNDEDEDEDEDENADEEGMVADGEDEAVVVNGV